MTTTSDHVRELTNQADELSVGELEHVSGGKQGGPKVPVYMEVKLKEVLAT